MEQIKQISNALVINPEFLTAVDVSLLECEQFESIKHRVIPTFCYDNAFLTATNLCYDKIVYGVALVKFGDSIIPVEHAWIKDNGQHFDPTYQVLNEKNGSVMETEYYSLIEFSIDEYLELSESMRGEELARLCALDFYSLRTNQSFKKYFNHKRGS